MITIENLKIDHRYDRLLTSWNDKIHKLEKSCSESEPTINKPSRAVLQNKIENLKSYFYSARYYAASIEEDSRRRLKELFDEMRSLESEISSIMNTKTLASTKSRN
jgi:DNA replicative helicase MCM subunit Mcm2 (Cdc46/Mcm family)